MAEYVEGSHSTPFRLLVNKDAMRSRSENTQEGEVHRLTKGLAQIKQEI